MSEIDLNDVFSQIRNETPPKTTTPNTANVMATSSESVTQKTGDLPIEKGPVVNKKVVDNAANTVNPKGSGNLDFLSGLIEYDDDNLRIKEDAPLTGSGKIPSMLLESAKNTWLSNLGYETQSEMKSMTNNALILGLLIRDLDITDDQRHTLVNAFPKRAVINDIVNYKRANPNDELTEALGRLESSLDEIKAENRIHHTWMTRSMAGVKHAIAWLFLERAGVNMGYAGPETSIREVMAFMKSDKAVSATRALDDLGDDDLVSEKTARNRKI